MTTEVVVLMGGRSSERDVSIMSGVAVSESLRDNGYNVTKIDFQNGDLLLEQLVKKSPDVIFNALHGKYGEDGCVQGLLNILGIPYTHSGVTASAIAMDKHMTKKVLDTSNILFPDHQILSHQSRFQHALGGNGVQEMLQTLLVVERHCQTAKLNARLRTLADYDRQAKTRGQQAASATINTTKAIRGRIEQSLSGIPAVHELLALLCKMQFVRSMEAGQEQRKEKRSCFRL